MPKIVEGHPFGIFVDAFRTNLMAVLGVFLAIYLAESFHAFAMWELPRGDFPWVYEFLLSPILTPLFWAERGFEVTGMWAVILLLVAISVAYIFARPIRFELILAFALTGMYLSLGIYSFLFVVEWPILIRAGGVTVLVLAIVAAGWWAIPWKYREWR